MKQFYIFYLLLWMPLLLSAQQDTSATKPAIQVSGLLDFYYGYSFNKPPQHELPGFMYSYHRHNEVGLNLGYLKVKYDNPRLRTNLAVAAGNYPQYNLGGEPLSLRHVFEANAGLALDKGRKLWFDAGIFASHIGFESLISTDNWTLTPSLYFSQSPSYLAGAKLTWLPSESWTLLALISNGWQRVYRVDGNSFPAFGTQITRTANGKTFNWSTFISSDDPDSLRRLRVFNDFFMKIELMKGLDMALGFDLGLQQSSKGCNCFQPWYALVLMQRASFTKKWAAAIRLEYFLDDNHVVVSTPGDVAFKTAGTSIDLDFAPIEQVLLRVEARYLGTEAPIFETQNGMSHSLGILMGSMVVKFP